jgi:hypothetical protein
MTIPLQRERACGRYCKERSACSASPHSPPARALILRKPATSSSPHHISSLGPTSSPSTSLTQGEHGRPNLGSLLSIYECGRAARATSARVPFLKRRRSFRHPSTVMAIAGHVTDASRTPSCNSAGGLSFNNTTTPSSSRWSKMFLRGNDALPGAHAFLLIHGHPQKTLPSSWST